MSAAGSTERKIATINLPFQQMKYIRGQDIAYIQNPKVATKSILLALWTKFDPDGAPDNPHFAPNPPFFNRSSVIDEGLIADMSAATFFSVVRNPYSRFLSAYLDKVIGRGGVPWSRISGSFGLSADDVPTITRLIDIMKDRDPSSADQHFRPQSINLMHGFAPLDAVFFIEQMSSVSAFLASRGCALPYVTLGRTGASTQVSEQITVGDAEKLFTYYQSDFDLYGYSQDPRKNDPAREAVALNNDRSEIEVWLRDFMRRRAIRPT